MEKGKVMGAGRRWAVDFSDNSTAPSSRDIPDPPGFTRASVDQDDSAVSRQKKDAEANWKAQFYKNFCTKLDNIMWKPTEDVANPSVLISLTC